MTTLLDRDAAPTTLLPSATRERWQPLRGGLLNLYRYDHEEFRYEQGRLLLRGNNGTGKSRVLALQLPFLLDGDVSPHRLEPDGDPAKRVEWNLLLGRHNDRLGYTWLEFGRRDPDGVEHYRTVGAGLHAVAGRGLVGKWFFVTDQRVGDDLYLQRANGTALTRDRLIESVAGHGEVYTAAAAYRAAVDRELFGLGDRGYKALVDLLVALRQPQLSRQLDERRLSAALSDALPPLSPEVVRDVAEALRSLEADREALDALVAARTGVDAFLADYRRYTQIIARRRAADVRELHAEYETTQRKLRAAEDSARDARTALEEAAARCRDLAESEAAAVAAEETLARSDRMRDAHTLDRARRDADTATAAATDARSEADRTAAARVEREAEQRAAAQRLDASRDEVAGLVRDAAERAATVGLGGAHEQACAALALPDGPDDDVVLPRIRTNVERVLADRRRGIDHLRRLERAAAAAEEELRVAKHLADAASSALDAALTAQQATSTSLDAASTQLAVDYGGWAQTTVELHPPDAEGIGWELEHWARTGDGASPVADAVARALGDARQRLDGARRDVQTRLEALDDELAGLRAEAERLRAGEHTPPPVPHTRDRQVREERAGAPLWALCDFADTVDAATRAGVEAALEAAGLLDAWVTPDGRLLDDGEHDTVLVAGVGPVPERNLGTVVRAEDPTVTAILARIGLGASSGDVWVTADGHWQVGPLHGAWSKPTAEHLGAGAREAARHRRLAELDAGITTREKVRLGIDDELAELKRRDAVAAAEAGAAPDDTGVRQGLADLAAAGRAVAEHRQRLADAESAVAARREAADTAASKRDDAAADLGLDGWVGRLDELVDTVSRYERALAVLWPTLRAHLDRRAQAAGAEARAAEAARTHERADQAADEAAQRAAGAAAERDTLQATVGSSVEEVLAELAAARGRVTAVREERRVAEGAQQEARTALAVARHDIGTHTEALAGDARRRQTAVDAFAAYAATGLLAVAHAELAGLGTDEAWSADRAVRTARRVEHLLADIDSDDLAWQRTQRDIHHHLQTLIDTLLPHGYEPSATMVDQVLVVTVPFQGRACSMTQLRDALAEEVATRQQILDAREREVLENHLIGEVAAHLHDLLRSGVEWVAEVNAELERTPTSTGMLLRFAWRPLPEPDLEDARRRLLGSDGLWSSDDRAALGGFLQKRIQAVREADETGTWAEHLAAALDYRTWHTFDVERRQDGTWKRLTRRTHGTGSGGEKAIALTLPQFAAAAAHYRAAPHAPRLILLDEAFVGVDADMRSKCMGLLTAFDLDFVMTSEREWGCYATVPGVAIYQLATRPGIDAVGVTRWVWNGRERLRDDQPLPRAAPPEETEDGLLT